MLRDQGHQVESCIRWGKLWWDIDNQMLASDAEIEQIADGIYSLAELEELFIKRRKEALGQL